MFSRIPIGEGLKASRPRMVLPAKNLGFTLIETLLAVGLTAILATSATPIFIDISQQSQTTSSQMVVSTVQTGVSMYQMESLATQRATINPQVLDSANIGLATPSNPFFVNVLNPSITAGWSKEGALAYRSPAGDLYVYDPQTGGFGTQGDTGQTNNAQYGTPVYSYAGLTFYDSGAIVDSISKLAYVPSLEGNSVALTLASGIQINTHDDNSAAITLENGEILKVADIHKPNFFNLSTDRDENSITSSDLWVQGGQAGESHYSTEYLKKEYNSDANGGSFNYEYTLNGDYSGGSLKKEYGYIYKTEYDNEKPQKSEGAWTKKANGDIEGVIKHSYNYEGDTRYGYNHPEAKYRFAFDQKSETAGDTETTYQYDTKSDVYTTQIKGKQEYKIDYDSSGGKIKVDESYTYEASTKQDRKKNTFGSEGRYKYKDGRDVTYKSQYDYKNKTYETSVIDNKTGKEQKYKGKF